MTADTPEVGEAPPEAEVPQDTVPQAGEAPPQADAPQADAPQAAAPQADTPHDTAPQADTPHDTAPHDAAPQADAPEDDAPEDDQGDIVRRHLKVSGRVQGVFYRETLRRMAVEEGVTGWARNTRDGLETVLQGPREVVDRLVKWCRHGPPHAVVIHVQVEEEKPAAETEFRVR